MKKAIGVFLLLCCNLFVQSQIANRYDVVISEIMADPTPQVGLPNAEFLELKNVSATAFNLTGWRISDATGTATITANFILQPDSFVILCSNTNVTAFSVFGRAIGVTSFPSLDNDGELLTLRSPQNRVIHSVSYTTEWYQSEIKKDGGWSLEMIDTKNPCSGMSNWKASNDNSGGTPGRINSLNAVNADASPPQLKRAYTADSITIILVFDEPLDSASGAMIANYSINGLTIVSAASIAPLFTTVQLKLSSPLQARTVYTITASNVTDCKGNAIGIYNKAKIGLPENAVALDIVINEILFNPKPNGFDYVEFYNRSNKIIDVSRLYIANRNSSGVLSSINKLSEQPFYVFPGDYIVVTEDAASLKMQYLVKNADAFLLLSSLPSFPDDEGTVVLVNVNSVVIDEVNYFDDWQFDLIADDEGVALERIDPDGPSQNKNNWHSAASTAGYGTPGYQNSQYKQTGTINATIEINPKIFSPDNDGFDDIATIQYQLSQGGYVANITIFDAGGRPVRYLVKNDLLSNKGSWTWDGLDEKKVSYR